jgi:hypothetical protein
MDPDIQERQAQVNAALANLPDFTDAAAVIAWLDVNTNALCQRGVLFDRPALLAAFAAGGWLPSVNVGPDFIAADARNHAGWIVGQWLESLTTRPANMRLFIADWRAKFAA